MLLWLYGFTAGVMRREEEGAGGETELVTLTRRQRSVSGGALASRPQEGPDTGRARPPGEPSEPPPAHSGQPEQVQGRENTRTGPSRALRITERAFLVGGSVLLVFLVYQLGVGTVLVNLRLVGWGIAPIIFQEFFAYVANTSGWLAAFPSPRPSIPFVQLLAARMAGDAVNYVTPTATLGGEFVRARFLRGQATNTSLMASVAVAKLSQTVGQIVFVIVGLVVVLDDTPLPAGIRHGLLAGLGLLSALVITLIVVQHRGMFAPMLRVVQRLGLSARVPELRRRLEHLDQEIARFHGDANGAFSLSCAGFFVGWVLGVVEVYLILWFLGLPATVQRALTIEVLSVAIDGMLFFVPGKLGTQEGGKVLIFTMLGLDPAKGLALGILRRIRELAWASIGLFILSRQQISLRRALQPSWR
ncbi:MAG: flippase-like domain-containing protein [Candidatus Binatia bacterium]